MVLFVRWKPVFFLFIYLHLIVSNAYCFVDLLYWYCSGSLFQEQCPEAQLKEENSVPKKTERGHESGGEKIPSSSGPSHLQAQRARSVMAILEHIYPNPPIPLDHTDNFTFLCAVIMSAQTTDGKVLS